MSTCIAVMPSTGNRCTCPVLATRMGLGLCNLHAGVFDEYELHVGIKGARRRILYGATYTKQLKEQENSP